MGPLDKIASASLPPLEPINPAAVMTSKKAATPPEEIKKTPPEEETKTLWEKICTFFANLFSPKEAQEAAIQEKRATDAVSFKPKIIIDPVNRSHNIQQQIDYTKELQGEQIEQEVAPGFWLAKEAGLDKEWLRLQVQSLALKNDMTLLDEQEIQRLHEVIKTVATKIEELQKEQLEKGEKSRILGKFESASSLLLLATMIVGAVVAALFGAAPLMAVIMGAASLWNGGVTIAKAVSDHSLKKIEAGLLGNREERGDLMKWYYGLHEETQKWKQANTDRYHQMAEVEKSKHKLLQMGMR